MSKGPGRIERAIRALFDAHPDLAFITDDLVEHCYPEAERVSDLPQRVEAVIRQWKGYIPRKAAEAQALRDGPAVLEFPHKYRVAALRAAHKVIDGDPDWRAWRIEGQGRGWVFLNHGNVQNYALARLIGDQFNVYRSENRHRRGGIMSGIGYVPDRAALLAQLEDRYRHHIAPGGGWLRFVQQHRAERDGDTELAVALKAQSDAALAAWSAEFRKRFSAPAAPGYETLIGRYRSFALEAADQLRALMTQNDPDAVRAGLAEIADALDCDGRARVCAVIGKKRRSDDPTQTMSDRRTAFGDLGLARRSLIRHQSERNRSMAMSDPKAARKVPGASTGQPTERAAVVPLHGGGRLMAPWQPGQSGNPNGVISVGAYHEARRICSEASPEAARIQVQLMNDEDSRIRLMATECVLNRGVGKPREADDQPTHIDLSGLSGEELQLLGTLLKKALGL